MTIKFVKYLILSFVLLLQISVTAQEKNNPFEVTHTKKYLSKKKDSKSPKAVKENTVTATNKTVLKSNTNKVDPKEELLKEERQLEAESAPIKLAKDQNPFQVNKTQSNNPPIIERSKSNDLDKKGVLSDDTTVDSTSVRDLSNSEIVNHPKHTKIGEENLIHTKRQQDNSNPFSVIKGAQKSTQTNNKETKKVQPQKVKPENRSTNKLSKYFNSQNETPQKKSTYVFWILFFTVFLFAILINYKRSFILKSYRGVLNENYLKLIKREENEGFSFFFLSLYFVFILSMTTFIYMILLKVMNIDISFLQFVYMFIAILSVYIVRFLFMRLLGYIFHLEQSTSKFFFIIIYYNILLGICLIAINIAFSFGSETIVLYSYYGGLFLIGILLLIRNIRGLLLSIQHKFIVKIQFIFYLCAVEIAPALISVKFLSDFV